MIIVLVVLGLVIVMAISIYNNLVVKRNQIDNIFGSVDTLLKKRYDLIPNLIATVKQYMLHEQKTLTDVTAMRAQAMSGNLNQAQTIDLENKLVPMIRGLMVSVENYPDLKANQNFLQLQASFNEIEEQISAARRAFNATVTDYNNAVQVFPSNIFAGMMNFQVRKVFEIPESERVNPNASELFKK